MCISIDCRTDYKKYKEAIITSHTTIATSGRSHVKSAHMGTWWWAGRRRKRKRRPWVAVGPWSSPSGFEGPAGNSGATQS